MTILIALDHAIVQNIYLTYIQGDGDVSINWLTFYDSIIFVKFGLEFGFVNLE